MKSPHWEVGQEVYVYRSSFGSRRNVSTKATVKKIYENGVIVVEYIYGDLAKPLTAKFSGKFATADTAWATGKREGYRLMIEKITPDLLERENAEKERKEADLIRRQIINRLERDRPNWNLKDMREILAKLDDTQ